MNSNLGSIRRVVMKRAVSLVTMIMLVTVTVGCASVNRLREAQDSFNQAAAAENTLRFDSLNPLQGGGSDTAATWSTSRNGYASALLSLEQIDNNDKNQLRADGLWGSALTLKALSQWRLGLFPKALATASEAQKNSGDQIYPRDRAVLVALPGLIKTDQAYDKILNKKPLVEVLDLLTGPSGSLVNIQNARLTVDKDHPVQVYLIQAQLAAYRNFLVAQDRLNNHATIAADDPARKNANEQLAELNRLLQAQQPGPAAQALIIYWVKLCALDMP
jgi:hypothetical protein